MDGVAAAFGEGNSSGIDEKDASKKWNMQESIGLFRNNTWQAIEFRPVPVLTDTLFYAIYYIQQQNYTLKITTQNITAGFPQAWLVDKYLNTKTAVNVDMFSCIISLPIVMLTVIRTGLCLCLSAHL